MTKNLLVINILAFLASWVLQRSGVDLNALLGLHFFKASDFHFYQFFTYMFLHGGFTHILFNMFALWMFGSVIERVWGPKKFLFYYIVCGVGAGIVQEMAQYGSYLYQGLADYQYVSMGGARISMDSYINLWTTIGASGAVYGILLAFGMIFPNERMFIIPFPFPIKAKWLIVGYIAIELFSAMSGPGDGVAHMAHLGGMLFGYLLIVSVSVVAMVRSSSTTCDVSTRIVSTTSACMPNRRGGKSAAARLMKSITCVRSRIRKRLMPSWTRFVRVAMIV